MPWMNSVLDVDRARVDLSQRLRRLERLFEFGAIRGESLDASRVAAYYRECHDAYRKHHSSEGAAHMALNPDGRFDPAGFHGQLRRIEASWPDTRPADVLELGFGQGFNLLDLAPRHPHIRFQGIDLTPEHLALARSRVSRAGLPNVRLALADLHALPQQDCSIDEVFAIEVFCYSNDAPRALAEVKRVLRPGGRLVLFDGYQMSRSADLEPDHALAAELVARGMALERWQVLDEFIAQARLAGFAVDALLALDQEIMPNLRRLERLVNPFVRLRWLARRALARRAPERSRNVLSGYLFHRTVAMGLLGYRHIVLRKLT